MKNIYAGAVRLPLFFACILYCSAVLGASGTMEASKSSKQERAPLAQTSGRFYTISAQEAKKRMDSGSPVIIVDVRTKAEYDESHIPLAVLIPNETIGVQRPKELPDIHAEILVYCRSGRRSRQAAEKLAAMGYTSVYDFGGIISWPYEKTGG